MDTMRQVGSWVFFVDQGAVYDVTAYADGTTTVTGRRSAVTYTSKDHRLSVTGTRRRQTACAAAPWPSYRVEGSRCVLTLDTGEGLSNLRGVLVNP